MSAMRMKVIYLDGREVTTRVSPAAQVAVEQALGGLGESNRLLMTYRFAYQALFMAGKESAPFDQWLGELIEDVEDLTGEPLDPPAGGAPQPESSSASPSEPAALSAS